MMGCSLNRDLVSTALWHYSDCET